GAVALRDGPQCVPQREVATQVGLLELRRPPAPVVWRQRGDALGRETVREQARLHRAVADDAGAVLGAPRDLPGGRLPADQREGRLERVDVSERLAAGEQRDVEV